MLSVSITGTDKSQYKVGSADITVTGVKKGTKLTTAKLTLVLDASSTVARTVVTATCPATVLGSGYVWFAPKDSVAVSKDFAAVDAAHKAFLKAR